MRKKIVAGNWKMNTSLDEGTELANQIVRELDSNHAKVILCPPFTHLEKVVSITSKNPTCSTGAQNCHHENAGAFTGEISSEFLSKMGVTYVIIGHSERRENFNESHALLQKKTIAAQKNGLTVIFCCGETESERSSNRHFEWVKKQLHESLFSSPEIDFSKLIVAYEPVWAIGTGKTATPEQAQEMHEFIRDQIAQNINASVAEDTSILYGGSCKPGNASELFKCADIDGGLIGGASLKADDFLQIINAF